MPDRKPLSPRSLLWLGGESIFSPCLSLLVLIPRAANLEKEVAGLRQKIHHLDDMLKSQQRKVRQMIEQVSRVRSYPALGYPLWKFPHCLALFSCQVYTFIDLFSWVSWLIFIKCPMKHLWQPMARLGWLGFAFLPSFPYLFGYLPCAFPWEKKDKVILSHTLKSAGKWVIKSQ